MLFTARKIKIKIIPTLINNLKNLKNASRKKDDIFPSLTFSRINSNRDKIIEQ
jgi:hypothetical protein